MHMNMVIIYYAPNHGKCIKIFVYTGKVWPKMSELERYGIWSCGWMGKAGSSGRNIGFAVFLFVKFLCVNVKIVQKETE